MSKILPVITLYQPWATWIMRGWKTIETRTHNRFKSLEGSTILIHAGLTNDGSALTTKNPYLTHKQIIQEPEEMVNGFILGSVHVYDFQKLNAVDSRASLIDCSEVERWGLFLNKINKFNIPIKAKGEMGIWYFDMDKMEKVKKPQINALTLF